MTKVTITHLYTSRGVCSAYVETDKGKVHRIGHLPWQGWACVEHGRRCSQVKHVWPLVPVAAIEYGARGVEAGVVPVSACVPERKREVAHA